MLDLLIKGGQIIDGTGEPRFPSDVGIAKDRIAAVGALGGAAARETIDAAGRIVAPGFIDVHTHSESWLLSHPQFTPKTCQGFTTEILMPDGISYAPINAATAAEWIFYLRSLDGLRFAEYRGWESLADFLTFLDRRSAQNIAAQVPYANVRTLFHGFTPGRVDDWQMRQIWNEIEKGLEAGAVGLSTGLDYIAQCWSNTDELVEALEPLRAARAIYVTHIRYKKGTLAGLQEAVEIGRRAGVPVHISHLKGSTTQETEAILDYIDRVAVNDVDFSFDVYPYMPGSTMLNYLLPYEVWENGPLHAMARLNDPVLRRRFAAGLSALDLNRVQIAWLPSLDNRSWCGRMLAEYIATTGRPAADALADLLIEEGMSVLLVFRTDNDDGVDPFLQHRCYMMGSDGIYHREGTVHPRMFGSAPRLLGRCVRDRQLFSLEDAVAKLTCLPARKFGLAERGEIRPGFFADITVFDPLTVEDRATYENPRQYPAGIEQVIVNGTVIIRDGQPVNAFKSWPGRVLRFTR